MFRLFILAAVAVAGIVGVAHAQTSCTRVGNTTYCSGAGSTYSCTRVGNTTYCN
jgi:hypothetical protein